MSFVQDVATGNPHACVFLIFRSLMLALGCVCTEVRIVTGMKVAKSGVRAQVAPSFVTGLAVLAIPLIPFIQLRSAAAFSWYFRHITTPASGVGTVYGACVTGAEVISKKELDSLRASSKERPDLSGGKAGAHALMRSVRSPAQPSPSPASRYSRDRLWSM